MAEKPAKEFTLNFVSATVWDNSEDKKTRFSIALTKSYKKDGEWKRTTTLNSRDIAPARVVLEQAYVWIGEERRRRATKARQDEPSFV